MTFYSKKWLATPDKVNHQTRGYTSKVIFNYQSLEGKEIGSGNDILPNIITTDLNYKGSNILPVNYFSDADGRTFKITMYFLQDLDGSKVDIGLYMTDIDEDNQLKIAEQQFSFSLADIGVETLVKYECEFSTFKSTSGLVAQGVGNITFSNADNDGTNVVFLPIYRPGALFTGAAIGGYSIDLVNLGGNTITVLSVIIEEIS